MTYVACISVAVNAESMSVRTPAGTLRSSDIKKLAEVLLSSLMGNKEYLGIIFLVLTVQFSGFATSWPVLDSAAFPLKVPTLSIAPVFLKGQKDPLVFLHIA